MKSKSKLNYVIRKIEEKRKGVEETEIQYFLKVIRDILIEIKIENKKKN